MSAPLRGADELDDFGSFTAAERLSDPYADVYGLPADQPGDAPAAPPAPLLAFSPALGPVSPSSLADPFADILAPSAPDAAAPNGAALLSFSPLALGGSDKAVTPATDLLSPGGGDPVATATPSASGLLLPPPRSSASPAFFSAEAAAAGKSAVDDLLSFSPLAADAGSAPFADVFGSIASTGASGSFDAGSDGLMTMVTAVDSESRTTNSFSVAAPVSAFDLSTLSDALAHVPASAPASLHGSFALDASSFAVSTTVPDDESDDWTDFVAADDAANEGSSVEIGKHGQKQPAMVWESADDASGAFGALGNGSMLVSSLSREENALDASSSSFGGFELPSPQSLGIEGAASASAELKPEMYFFSQGSSEATGVGTHMAEQGDNDNDGITRNDSEDEAPTTSSLVDAEHATAASTIAVETNDATKEEADLWGPLSPPSSSHALADIEVETPAVAGSSSSSASQDTIDVSALDPFSSAGSSTNAPMSNDFSGGYYDLLAGMSLDSSAPIEFAPIEFTSAVPSDEDAFGDFAAGPVLSSSDPFDEDADVASDFVPVSSLTPSSSVDNSAGDVPQQSATSVFDDDVAHASVMTSVHEESNSDLASSFSGIVTETVDSVGSVNGHSSDTAERGDFESDDPFGTVAQEPTPPEDIIEAPVAIASPDNFEQSFAETADALGVESRAPDDDFGGIAHSLEVSTTESIHAVEGDAEFDDFAGPSSFSVSVNLTTSTDDDAFGTFAQSTVFSSDADANGDGGDDFGDFAHSPAFSSSATANNGRNGDDFGDFVHSPAFSSNTPVNDGGDDDGFGDFAHSTTFTGSATANDEDDDDGFGDFAQSTAPSADADDDFGDFAQSSGFGDGGDNDFGDFSASPAPAASSSADDDGFGDFSSPLVSVEASSGKTMAVGSFATDEDLGAFFRGAFADVSVSVTIAASTGDAGEKFTSSYMVDSVSTPMTAGFVADIVNAAVKSYVATASADQESKRDSDESSSSNKLGDDTYVKYVLTEKIQEASLQNGIFPHGSDAHQSYLSIAATESPAEMRAALQRLQDELFHKSVNDAMMRIARQAALSAKAKIAEQAAQQQANAKGSSLLATTRQLLLSRNSGASGSGSSGSGGHDKDRSAAAGGGSLGVLTPTGASVHKHSRFSFGHEDASASSSAAGGGDGKSDMPKRRHSGSSEADVARGSGASTGAARTNSFGGASSNGGAIATAGASSNGSLMKKFQDRFSSFSSSRQHKTRVVSLRRMGQSGEDVRAMEINMDSISGGLDEVKWKCARFLYDVEEVAHVAPAQIRILSYPGNQVLSSKSDRSALVKFLKPGAVWTIDIGASNNDMLNEW